MSGATSIGGLGSRPSRAFDGVSTWTWVREKHLRGYIGGRGGGLDQENPIQGAQVLFRLGQKPEVRLNRDIRGRRVKEGRSVRRSSDDETATGPAESNVIGLELPQDEAGTGHITALIVASEIHITFQGAAETEPITRELAGSAHYIAAAKRLLGDPSLPDDPLYEAFADAAHTAAEMIARAELGRLPDHLPFRKHSQVSSRYHEWAKLGNTELLFPKLLDATFDWQRRAKYDRSNFSLTPAEAAACIEMLDDMHKHASRRPREATSFPVTNWLDSGSIH
jgi:hypothetical protein